MEAIKNFIRQLFCKHDYELMREVYSYTDSTGVHVVVYVAVCIKCGKVINQRVISEY